MDSLIIAERSDLHEVPYKPILRHYAANAEGTQRTKLLVDKVCQGRRTELAEAVDNILRGLRVLRDAQVKRPQEMRDFLSEIVPALYDQIANVDARIDADADEYARFEPSPLDLSELHAFLESGK